MDDIWTDIGIALAVGWLIGIGLFIGPWAVREVKRKMK